MKLTPLSELVEPVLTWNPARALAEGSFRYIDLSAIDQDTKSVVGAKLTTYADAPSRARQLVAQGDALVSTVRPNLNGVAMVGEALDGATASTGFCVLRPRAAVLDGRYLFHWIKSPGFIAEMVKKAIGASYPAVSDRVVLESRIPLPPLTEQRRIAAILDHADALRAKRREALEQLDSLAMSLFTEMFGEQATNSRSWDRCSLGELILDGPQNGLYKPASDYGAGTPIVRIDAFYDGVVTGLATLKRVQVNNNEIARYGLREDDILINRVNSPDYLGKSALVPALPESVVFESNMMRFSVKPERASARYIVAFLQTAFVKNQIRTASKDAVNQSSINQQDVKSFLVNLPPMHLQRAFVERLDEIERIRVANEASASTLDKLFASVQNRAFCGVL